MRADRLCHFTRQCGFVRTVVLALVILVPGLAGASDSDSCSVVLARNGNVVKGKIVERIAGKKITVMMANGNRMEVSEKDISEIFPCGENYQDRQKQIQDSIQAHRIAPLKVVSNFIQAQISVRSGDSTTVIGVSSAVGILSNKNFSVAFGLGWDSYEDGSFLPLTNEIHYYLSSGSWSPYLHLLGGYSIGWLKEMKGADYGGFRWGAGAGVEGQITKTVRVIGQLSFEQQSIGQITTVRQTRLRWTSVTIGIKF